MKYIRFVTTKKVHITDDIEDSFRRKRRCAAGSSTARWAMRSFRPQVEKTGSACAAPALQRRAVCHDS